MERLFGLVLFFIGIGIVIGLLVAETFIAIIVAAVFLLCGYHLFCR